MKKRSTLLAILCTGVLALAGCSGQSEEGNGSAGNTEDLQVQMILKTLSHPYWKSVEAGAKQAAEDLGVSVEVNGPPSEADVIDQVNMIDNAISQSADALVVAPSQPSTVANVFDLAKSSDIPVLLVDTDADWEDKVTFIGTDNFSAGKEAGEYLASLLKEGDKVALVEGAKGNLATDERIDGAKEALEAAGIEIAAQLPADSDKFEAAAVIDAILQNHSDLAGVFAANDDMAIGALSATDQAGVQIPIVGINGGEEATELIINGKLAASVAQSPFDMGYMGVENAVKAINGDEIEKRIPTPIKVVTEENAEEHLQEIQ
ncbi:sugar ABC transporter substrate-binding protein [Domibacillus enclensis]|uniref:Ribose transport system substrate-binding protein n=1 Tax=Domibacillus enclensis TaxID=1017273 RepID=A0A1N6VB49_9BACI|nr:sugar ABC transporter substrate-binding protein [Domibacillus enclensis]OXS78741.1 sugar ABC transporter substrate-binding protein [Domibacillus enclensis]SIQ75091.1 ribose transport system substrate-binding protein [Domibacillus enclensis]